MAKLSTMWYGFYCGVCTSKNHAYERYGDRSNEWCSHFMENNSKEYEENLICPIENWGVKFKLLSIRNFDTVCDGKLHNVEGCGDFIFCNSCFIFIYNPV